MQNFDGSMLKGGENYTYGDLTKQQHKSDIIDSTIRQRSVEFKASSLKYSPHRSLTPVRASAPSFIGQTTLMNHQVEEWQSQFFKTKLCPYQLGGRCINDQRCRFAHTTRELRQLPNLHRTKLCESYIKKEECRQMNCSYAHNPCELRTSSHTFYKVTLCNFYKKGRCWNGIHCRFAHGTAELQSNDILSTCPPSSIICSNSSSSCSSPSPSSSCTQEQQYINSPNKLIDYDENNVNHHSHHPHHHHQLSHQQSPSSPRLSSSMNASMQISTPTRHLYKEDIILEEDEDVHEEKIISNNAISCNNLQSNNNSSSNSNNNDDDIILSNVMNSNTNNNILVSGKTMISSPKNKNKISSGLENNDFDNTNMSNSVPYTISNSGSNQYCSNDTENVSTSRQAAHSTNQHLKSEQNDEFYSSDFESPIIHTKNYYNENMQSYLMQHLAQMEQTFTPCSRNNNNSNNNNDDEDNLSIASFSKAQAIHKLSTELQNDTTTTASSPLDTDYWYNNPIEESNNKNKSNHNFFGQLIQGLESLQNLFPDSQSQNDQQSDLQPPSISCTNLPSLSKLMNVSSVLIDCEASNLDNNYDENNIKIENDYQYTTYKDFINPSDHNEYNHYFQTLPTSHFFLS